MLRFYARYEDAVSVVVTTRSIRIIDSTAGETLFKSLLMNTTFAAVVPGGGDGMEVFGMVSLWLKWPQAALCRLLN